MAACSLPSTQRTLLRSFNPWILRGIGIEAGGIITYLIIVLAVTLTVLRAAFGRIFRESHSYSPAPHNPVNISLDGS